MTSADEALAAVLESASPLGIERIPTLDALGRVLAAEIRSARDVPAFDNSAMDGYALRAADVASSSESNPVKLTVIETIAAGVTPARRVERGQASRIMTGAQIPPGADTVVPVERTDGGQSEVLVMARVEPGFCIRPRGEDLRRDELVIGPGKRLTAADLGVLASLNRSMVGVYRKPSVAIVTTGDELVDIDQVPTGAQVVNSNAYALAAAIREAGAEPVMLPIARDNPEEIRERLNEAARFDLALSTGGVSVGQFDHVKVVLDELGMRTLFHGVAQRPGRPLKFGLVRERPFFGLPGNPVSAMVCFYLYVRPALMKMGGRPDLSLARIQVRCATDIKLATDLTEFVRVRIERRDGEYYAAPSGNQGSGVLSALASADGLLVGPAKQTVLKAGAQATVLLLDPAAGADTEAFFEERRRQRC